MSLIEAVPRATENIAPSNAYLWQTLDVQGAINIDPTTEAVAGLVTWMDDSALLPNAFWSYLADEGYTQEDLYTLAGEDRGQLAARASGLEQRLATYTRTLAHLRAQRALFVAHLDHIRALKDQMQIESSQMEAQGNRERARLLALDAVALDRLIEDSIEMVDDFDQVIDSGNLEAARALAQGAHDNTQAALVDVAEKTTGGEMNGMQAYETGALVEYQVADLLPAQPTFMQRIIYQLPSLEGTPFLEREVILFSRWKMAMSRFLWIVIGLVFLLMYWREIARFLGFKVKRKKKKRKILGIF